jgi:acetyl esterase
MPSLDPHVQRLVAILAANGRSSMQRLSVAQRRAALAELLKLGGPAPPMQRIEDSTVPGPAGALPIRVYTPLEPLPKPAPALVYFHGGGWVAGSIEAHDGIARALAAAGACRVVSVGYRLGPEHPYPAAIEDAFAAVSHMASHAGEFCIDVLRLGVCGDSAGGTLAAVTCQRLAHAGVFRPALQLLLCPILDCSPEANSRRDFSSGDPIDRATLEHDLDHYLPRGADRSHPQISPLSADDFAHLPPTIMHTAECDPLEADGRRYVERLRAAGGTVTYRCHPGMIHLFYGLGGVIPYARHGLEAMGADLRQAWHETAHSQRATIGTEAGAGTLT